jgi:hypothetical protein
MNYNLVNINGLLNKQLVFNTHNKGESMHMVVMMACAGIVSASIVWPQSIARAAQTVTVKVKEIVTQLEEEEVVVPRPKQMETKVTVYKDGKVVVQTYEVTVSEPEVETPVYIQ